MECDQLQTFNEAYENSSAIFSGEVVEIKQSAIDTSHHGKSTRQDVKFKVLKSWRSVNNQFVWVETSAGNLRCGGIEFGKIYLIYANESNSKLFIHPNSRTMLIENNFAAEDLKKLGNSSLYLKDGEFGNQSIGFYGLLVLIPLIVALVFFVYLGKRVKQI